jgi:oxygen-independent coproporphyrinogen-3 oxidase
VGASPPPDDDDQADKYAIADAVLGTAGFEWYEISNWARPGQECRHNLVYWTGGDYLAIGCAAHGYTAGRRWWTVRTPERYIERVTGGSDLGTEAGSETLTATARAEEAFALAIRLRTGALLADGAATTARDLADGGLLDPDALPGRAVLTRAGRLMGSDVTARLLLAGASDRTPETRVPAGTRYH